MSTEASQKALAKARAKLDKEYRQVRDALGDIHVKFDAVIAAREEDDIESLLAALEKAVKNVRTGGLVGSGAKGHRRALKDYREKLEADATAVE
ncbi:MAG: hypothetical protein HKN26_14680 [Acidimicrobiales bacterium]|nr:hypothetical protein [Acidimicrobiales bacterium]